MFHRSSTFPSFLVVFITVFVMSTTVSATNGRSSRKLLQIPNYISPFIGFPQPSPFHASPIYNLPLKFLSNAKPMRILSGALETSPPLISTGIIGHFPALSKVFRLPLKYVSNAKPMRVFFKKPFQFL